MAFIIFYYLTVVSRRKKKRNQSLVNDILILKIIMEKRLPKAHQDRHKLDTTQPKTNTQRSITKEKKKKNLHGTVNGVPKTDGRRETKRISGLSHI
ncbi:unnamed protein product [Spirodela intermedia]|uniref:Uncharacterized protein n=1 Tax=Spirodela intermedia TaxID=51605 RepID=A0A7I8IN98_SPIIN|nr:unnamed protein product [Spirodela intermedia]CAA6659447.1 unnamed protein product [Spirodela intermedia]